MRPITESEIQHYHDHGAVYLPDLLDESWLARLQTAYTEEMPDIENHKQEYDVVYYPVKPGNAIVDHVRTVHGSTGNTSKRDRRALALRYLSDDVRYMQRQDAPPDSQKSATLVSEN